VPAPAFIAGILGLRGGVPNNADRDSPTSVNIARELMTLVLQGAEPRTALAEEAAGTELERSVENYLREQLAILDADRAWVVGRRLQVADFVQYRHLARLNELVRGDATLRVELGRDYVIRPDVTVGVQGAEDAPTLHAAVSCKWTIRSDRVQNIRHEATILTRNRRGRQPHIVAVTAEPLPSRLASIAMGTGEVDAVYHVALDELVLATEASNARQQVETLALLIAQRRLLAFSTLPSVLVTT
jgi:hypothetical protein